MSRTIKEVPLALSGGILQLPDDARILQVNGYGGKPCLIVLGSWDAPTTSRLFHVYASGEFIPEMWAYCGTAHLDTLGMAAHVFEGTVSTSALELVESHMDRTRRDDRSALALMAQFIDEQGLANLFAAFLQENEPEE